MQVLWSVQNKLTHVLDIIEAAPNVSAHINYSRGYSVRFQPLQPQNNINN